MTPADAGVGMGWCGVCARRGGRLRALPGAPAAAARGWRAGRRRLVVRAGLPRKPDRQRRDLRSVRADRRAPFAAARDACHGDEPRQRPRRRGAHQRPRPLRRRPRDRPFLCRGAHDRARPPGDGTGADRGARESVAAGPRPPPAGTRAGDPDVVLGCGPGRMVRRGKVNVEAVAQVRRTLTDIRGLPFRAPVPALAMPPADIRATLAREIDQSYSPADLEHLETVYRHVGFLTADQGLRPALERIYEEEAGGFYDPRQK